MKAIKKLIVLLFCLMNLGSFAQINSKLPKNPNADVNKTLPQNQDILPIIMPLMPNITAGKYYIRTTLTNRFLDVQQGNPAAGTTVQIYDFNGLWAQVWELIPSGEADFFYVKSEMGRYLDVKGGNPASQTDVWIWDFNGGDAQKWHFIPSPLPLKFSIQSKLGTYLDVSGGATDNGSKVWTYNNAGFSPQFWEMKPAGEGNPLSGFVDMHTHPMIHLAFGGHLVYGAPDVGSPILAGQRFQGWDAGHTTMCNESLRNAVDVNDALNNCQAMHGGHGVDNSCGDYIRAEIVGTVDKYSKLTIRNGALSPVEIAGGHLEVGHLDHEHSGYPNFTSWPHFSSVVHQQMWIDWIRRAHEKGNLNVMVALATNNEPLSLALKGTDPFLIPTDDISSGSLQIKEIKNLVSRHTDFMEIALNPSDLKRIVRAGKLAIILGIELDDFGNFNKQNNVTPQNVKDMVDYWYNLGVRYAFPIHTTDNKFGGTAIYENSFNYSNRVATGHYWDIKCSLPSDNITARFAPSLATFLTTILKTGITDSPPALPNCSAGLGHLNGLDMQDLGFIALTELMKKGIMIDIDHMGQRTALQSLLFGQRNNYPMNSGHNGMRGAGADEKTRTIDMVNLIKATGGMFGVGWGNGKDEQEHFTSTAETFLTNFNGVLSAMAYKNVAIGTDINGLVPTPGPRAGSGIVYDDVIFPRCRLGNKKWDYNTDGVAHYGLFPEFIMDIKTLSSGEDAMKIFNKSPEYFAQMWEKCERQSISVR
jgi:microsomal dipeptidase-like Zn-dependent dipeptidase